MPIIHLTKEKVEQIKELLIAKPTYRDNDRKLIAHIWYKECIKLKLLTPDVKLFLDNFADGKLMHPETIRRYRQELQANNPELRTELWEDKHKTAKVIAKKIKKK